MKISLLSEIGIPSKLGFGAILKRMRAASFADIWNDLFSGNKIRFGRAINTMIY